MADKPVLASIAGELSSAASDEEDIFSEAELEQVLKVVPKGALVLSGLAVGSLMLAWLAVYFLVFLPRGPIG